MIAVNSFYRIQERYLQSNMVSKVLVYDGRNIDCHASCFYARQDLTTTQKRKEWRPLCGPIRILEIY